jgi:hypothetical protein
MTDVFSQSLHKLIKPRPVPSCSTADFRQTLMGAGIEKFWGTVFREATKTLSVFDAAMQLVRRYGHTVQPASAASSAMQPSPRSGGSSSRSSTAAMVLSREEFGQWCRACGFGTYAIAERDWKAICARARKNQRARIRSIWVAVLMERRSTAAAAAGDGMVSAELGDVLQRMALPLASETVDLLLRKAAGFVTQQRQQQPEQRRRRAVSAEAPILSLSEFLSWWDQVEDVQLALAEARLQQADVGAMLAAVTDKTTPQTPTVIARTERLTLAKSELEASIAALAQTLTRQGGDVLPCQAASLTAIGVAETFGSLLAPAELRCSRAEFFAAAAPVPGGSTEIGIGGMARRARGEERVDEITDLWTFLDSRAVGFVDLCTFEQRLGGGGGTGAGPAAAAAVRGGKNAAAGQRARMPAQLAREWEGPALDGLRRRLHAKIKQRLWRDLLAVADVLGDGRAGQVEYAGFVARCKLRHAQGRSQPAAAAAAPTISSSKGRVGQ